MNFLGQIGAAWGRLTSNQRLLVGGLAAGLVVLAAFLVSWAAQPEYAVLYSNLEPGDGSSILDRLRADKVPYQVRDGGRSILVPERQVYETRLSLAGEGLPGSGTGYEILDTNKFGWTDFVQKLQYRRALEGEIARTVQTLDEIQSARIHLVVPEPSLFVADEKPSTASVVLKLRPGARLSPAQVRGIVHLVSSAVEGLQPENVSLLDVAGNLLSEPKADPLIGATSDQISLVRGLEEQLTQKVQSLLETVLGPGKAVVRIAAEMSFERKDATVETFDSENPVVRSEEKTDQAGADGSKNVSSTTNYEISKRTERILSPTGEVKRLTCSVFVDGTYTQSGKQRTYVPRTPAELGKYENIIKTAIGWSGQRGDQLTVENVQFDTSAIDRERKEMENGERMTLLLGLGGKIGSVLLVLLVLFLLMRMVQRSAAPPAPATAAIDVTVGGTPELLTAGTEEEQTEFKILQRKIQDLAKENPDDLSRLLRLWLRESV